VSYYADWSDQRFDGYEDWVMECINVECPEQDCGKTLKVHLGGAHATLCACGTAVWVEGLRVLGVSKTSGQDVYNQLDPSELN
jgi:hypothetical protein